jgi:transcriptional regulator with XRE-family HTH domain
MDVGTRIKEIAKSKNISPRDLGNKIGKTRQAVYDIYNGRVSVNVDVLVEIADALNEPVISFFTGEPDDYYKLVPMAIPVSAILELMSEIHEHAKAGKGMVNLHLSKSREGILILERYYYDLKDQLAVSLINRFGNDLYESFRISSPEKLRG